MTGDLFVPFGEGDTDFDVEGARVDVRGSVEDGSREAVMVPMRARRLDDEAFSVYRLMQRKGMALQKLHGDIEELVPVAREHGISWGLIAAALGIQAETARKRWGVEK